MPKPARLGQCSRCKAYGLVDETDGLRLAVDVAPVDLVGFGVAVSSGVRLWWVTKGQNGASRVLGSLSGTRRASWSPEGAQTGSDKLHAEHSCGASARDMAIVQVQDPKGSAPATPGAAEDGNPRRAAPVGVRGRTSRSPATSVTLPRSDSRTAVRSSEILGRCGLCRRKIRPGEPHWSITYGTDWIAGDHEECP